MKFASYIDYFGTPAKEIPCITGVGAPTSTTVGTVGCLYMAINTGNIYKCISDARGVYIWEDLNAESRELIAKLEDTVIALAERVKVLEENGVTGGGGATVEVYEETLKIFNHGA